jgi:hypothetical protein
MTIHTVVNFDQQAGITATGESFVVQPDKDVNVACILTSGSPATGARVQVTLDEHDKIIAGTAQWLNSPLGARTVSGGENVIRPVTGVRLSVTDGTWTFQVRQA